MEDVGLDTMATCIHRGKDAIFSLIVIIQSPEGGDRGEKLPFHPP